MSSFITDFNTWRKSQITTNYSSYSTVDVNTLTAEKFVALTSHQDVTDSTTNVTEKKDVVKLEADSYLINVILYHLNDLGLKALDVARPTLSDEILKTFQNDTGYGTQLEKYAKLWLLATIHQQNIEKKTVSRVKINAVEKDFKELQSSKEITTVNMRLTFIAVTKKCPDFLSYIYNADKLVSKVRNYLLDEEYKKTWVKTTFEAIKDQINTADFSDTERFTELKSKLDILDPSFKLSSDVLNEYYSELYVLFGCSSIQKNPTNKNIFYRVTLDALQKIAAKPDHQWFDTVVQAKNLFKGNIASVANQISRAIFDLYCDRFAWVGSGVSTEHVLTVDSARFVNKMSKLLKNNTDVNPAYKQLLKDQKLYRLATGLFILCNAAVIYAGFKSYDKLTTIEKVLLWVNTVVSGVDAVTSVAEAASSGYNAYLWIGRRVKSLMKLRAPPIRPASAAGNVSKWAKYLKVNYVLKYITTALIVVSMAFTVYDIVTSIQNQDWGMLALSMVEFAVSFGLLVLTFMAATAWSGPVSLVLTGILIVIGLIKMFWEQIKQFFHDVGRFFDTLFNGDPAVNYVLDSEDKYHVTDREYKQHLIHNLLSYAKQHPEEKQMVQQVIRNILRYYH